MTHILVVTGPSATGKTTLLERLHDQEAYAIVPGLTTRPPRSRDFGMEHIDAEAYEALAQQGLLLGTFHGPTGSFYGTRLWDLLDALADSPAALTLTAPACEHLFLFAQHIGVPLVPILLLPADGATMRNRMQGRTNVSGRMCSMPQEIARARHSFVPFIEIDDQPSVDALFARVLAAIREALR